jgi:serine/threonine-protein kinase
MSPEQAEGDLEHLGPRSDVYSLGATLYCLLTGRPAFAGDAGDVIPAVQKGESPPPRAIDPTIDWALEAVCLKAMSLRPEDRYGSCRALADDIERWMADEPVSAWREPLSARARRWARHHRTAVTATAAALLVALAGMFSVLVVQARANSELRRSNGALAAANQRERAQFQLAMEAIKLFHGEVSADLLLKERQFETLRTWLLRGAAEFYGKLEGLLEGQADPASRTALGRAYDELGELTAQIGNKPEALAVHRKALAVRRELASRPGADAGAALDLARSLIAAGRLQDETGRPATALASYAEARSLLSGLAGPGADRDAIHCEVARSDYWTGSALRSTGRRREALTAFERARAIVAELAGSRPEVVDYQRLLSWCDNDTGLLLQEEGKMAEALAAYERSRQAKQKIADDHPGVVEFQHDLAIPFNNRATALARIGRTSEALAAHQKANAILRTLGETHPAVTRIQSDLARSDNNIGILLYQTGRTAEALEAFEKALPLRRKLAEAHPDVTQFQADLAANHSWIGWLLYLTRRPREAMEAYERARSIYQTLVEAPPKSPGHRNNLANVLTNMTESLRLGGRFAEARVVCDQALEIRQALVEADPATTWYRSGLAESLLRSGQVRRSRGDVAGAVRDWRRAIALYEGLPARAGEVAFLEAGCHASLSGAAGLDGAGVPRSDGPCESDRGMEILRRAVAAGHRDADLMRTDAALDSIRSRPDFRMLMMDLAMPTDPFSRVD